MSKRMNVAVSENLYQRYQTVKDEIDNVSAIFQQALEPIIEFIEVKNKLDSNKDKIVNKLKYQKKHYENVVFNEGKIDGLNYAGNLDYEDFFALEKLSNKQDQLTIHGVFLKLNDFPENIQDDILPEDFEDDEIVFLEGWLEGAMELWDSIKGEI